MNVNVVLYPCKALIPSHAADITERLAGGQRDEPGHGREGTSREQGTAQFIQNYQWSHAAVLLLITRCQGEEHDRNNYKGVLGQVRIEFE